MKMKKEKDCVDKVMDTSLIVLGSVALILIGIVIGQGLVDVKLTQETADDICQQLTGNFTAVASESYNEGLDRGKLICTTPSFDSAQNIIIKSNNK